MKPKMAVKNKKISSFCCFLQLISRVWIKFFDYFFNPSGTLPKVYCGYIALNTLPFCFIFAIVCSIKIQDTFRDNFYDIFLSVLAMNTSSTGTNYFKKSRNLTFLVITPKDIKSLNSLFWHFSKIPIGTLPRVYCIIQKKLAFKYLLRYFFTKKCSSGGGR